MCHGFYFMFYIYISYITLKYNFTNFASRSQGNLKLNLKQTESKEVFSHIYNHVNSCKSYKQNAETILFAFKKRVMPSLKYVLFYLISLNEPYLLPIQTERSLKCCIPAPASPAPSRRHIPGNPTTSEVRISYKMNLQWQ